MRSTSTGRRRGRDHLPREVRVLVGAGFLVAIGYGIVAPVLPTYAAGFGVGIAAASTVVSARRTWRVAGSRRGRRAVRSAGPDDPARPDRLRRDRSAVHRGRSPHPLLPDQCMEVVTVLRTGTPEGLAAVAVSDRARLLLWSLAVADVMAFAWMLSTGEWLNGASPVTAVVTLGGHHLVVLWLAVSGFALLALVTVLTRGLTSVRRIQVPFLVLGAVASVVALGGALSVLVMTAVVVLLIATIGASLASGRFVFVGGSLFRRR